MLLLCIPSHIYNSYYIIIYMIIYSNIAMNFDIKHIFIFRYTLHVVIFNS